METYGSFKPCLHEVGNYEGEGQDATLDGPKGVTQFADIEQAGSPTGGRSMLWRTVESMGDGASLPAEGAL